MKISIRYKEVLADNDSNNSESLDARQYAPRVSHLFCGHHPGLILHCAMTIENEFGAGTIKLQTATVV